MLAPQALWLPRSALQRGREFMLKRRDLAGAAHQVFQALVSLAETNGGWTMAQWNSKLDERYVIQVTLSDVLEGKTIEEKTVQRKDREIATVVYSKAAYELLRISDEHPDQEEESS